MRGSSWSEGPLRVNRSAGLEEESSFLLRAARGAFLLLDIAFEALKKLLPYAGLRDEHIAPVRLVADPPQIAERTQCVQGARDHRLGHAEQMGEAADRMRAGGEIDQEHQRHLAVGEVRLT